MRIKSKRANTGLAIAVLVLTTAFILVLLAVFQARPPHRTEAHAGPSEASGPPQPAAHAASAPFLPAPTNDEGREFLAAEDDGSAGAVDADSILVEVFVRDARTDMPIGGAAVNSDGAPVAVTNGKGHARFPADAGRWLEVRATAPGWCPGIARVRAESGAASAEASLTLVPAAEVYGVVRGLDGAPAQGAEVVLHLDNPGFMRPVASGVNGLESGARVRTDGEGAFRFAGIGSKKGLWRARVTVLHDRCARFEGESFDLHNGAEVGPLLCELREGATIRGRVTTSGTGARSTIFLAEGGAQIQTDASGSYGLFHVPPGPVTLCAFLNAQPGVRASIPLDLRPGEERIEDVALDYEMCAFIGVVSTPDGVPLPGVQVWCEMEGFDPEPIRYGTRARSDGAYRLQVPAQLGGAEPHYTLRLERWEEDCAVAVSPLSFAVDLSCAGSALVELTAVDRISGRPLELFDPVWVPAADPGASLVLSDFESWADGRFVAVVPPGAGELRLRPFKYVRLGLPMTTRSGEHINLGRVDFDPEP